MKKLTAFFLATILSVVWNTALATCGVIVDPEVFDSNDPSAWVWYVLCQTAQGTTVTQRSFAYGWLPTEGVILIDRIGSANADNIFGSGFEANIPLTGAGGGVMDPGWWQGGPPNWQTNRVVTTLTAPGQYRFYTSYTNPGVIDPLTNQPMFARSRHTITVP